MNNDLVVIHQPDFLPYIGFFDRLNKADRYVIFDNVQFVSSSRGWTHRDKIKTKNGEKWLTISTKKVPRDTKINEIYLFEENDWRQRHLNLISENYHDAKYYNEILPYVEELYSYKCEKMMDFNLKSISILMYLFGIRIDTLYASSLNPQGRKSSLIVDIMRRIDSKRYLSGVGAEDYHDQTVFDEAGIEVIWQKFVHPVYPQLHGKFIPYLSSIDLLFNCGIDYSRKLLRNL